MPPLNCDYAESPLKINVQLHCPFPLPVDHVVIEPDWSRQETDVLGKKVVHAEPAPADEVLAAGIIRSKRPLVVFVAGGVFDLPKTIVVADHSSGVVELAARPGDAGQLSREHRVGLIRIGLTATLAHQDRIRVAVVAASVDPPEGAKRFAHDKVN